MISGSGTLSGGLAKPHAASDKILELLVTGECPDNLPLVYENLS